MVYDSVKKEFDDMIGPEEGTASKPSPEERTAPEPRPKPNKIQEEDVEMITTQRPSKKNKRSKKGRNKKNRKNKKKQKKNAKMTSGEYSVADLIEEFDLDEEEVNALLEGIDVRIQSNVHILHYLWLALHFNTKQYALQYTHNLPFFFVEAVMITCYCSVI